MTLDSLKPDATEPTMLVMSDVDDVFLPKPTDLLLNIVESRNAIENLLNRIPSMFAENTVVGGAIGPGLQAGHKMIVRGISCNGSLYLISPSVSHWW
jgi:protein transport protein SEC24